MGRADARTRGADQGLTCSYDACRRTPSRTPCRERSSRFAPRARRLPISRKRIRRARRFRIRTACSLRLPDARALRYEPHPFGLPSARNAVAADQRRRGARVDPAQVVLTASTSEAYSWLFKLLCDPGEAVLVPRPSYPLFEHLTALEGIRAHPYALEYHGRWAIDVDSIAAAPQDVRAVLVVSPNNPTGSYLDDEELQRLSRLCRERRWALVADEVFADYALDAVHPLTDIAARSEVLSFTLAGLSKSVGLPQLKLGWCIAGGPQPERDAALAALGAHRGHVPVGGDAGAGRGAAAPRCRRIDPRGNPGANPTQPHHTARSRRPISGVRRAADGGRMVRGVAGARHAERGAAGPGPPQHGANPGPSRIFL